MYPLSPAPTLPISWFRFKTRHRSPIRLVHLDGHQEASDVERWATSLASEDEEDTSEMASDVVSDLDIDLGKMASVAVDHHPILLRVRANLRSVPWLFVSIRRTVSFLSFVLGFCRYTKKTSSYVSCSLSLSSSPSFVFFPSLFLSSEANYDAEKSKKKKNELGHREGTQCVCVKNRHNRTKRTNRTKPHARG